MNPEVEESVIQLLLETKKEAQDEANQSAAWEFSGQSLLVEQIRQRECQ